MGAGSKHAQIGSVGVGPGAAGSGKQALVKTKKARYPPFTVKLVYKKRVRLYIGIAPVHQLCIGQGCFKIQVKHFVFKVYAGKSRRIAGQHYLPHDGVDPCRAGNNIYLPAERTAIQLHIIFFGKGFTVAGTVCLCMGSAAPQQG